MLKVNELLDRTSKTVSSVATISLGLAVIAVSAVVVKENLKDLLHLRKIKAHIICVKEAEEVKSEPVEEGEAPKASPKKSSGSKKSAPKPVVDEEVKSEEK